jgi:hypothetical protein
LPRNEKNSVKKMTFLSLSPSNLWLGFFSLTVNMSPFFSGSACLLCKSFVSCWLRFYHFTPSWLWSHWKACTVYTLSSFSCLSLPSFFLTSLLSLVESSYKRLFCRTLKMLVHERSGIKRLIALHVWRQMSSGVHLLYSPQILQQNNAG